MLYNHLVNSYFKWIKNILISTIYNRLANKLYSLITIKIWKRKRINTIDYYMKPRCERKDNNNNNLFFNKYNFMCVCNYI